MSYLTVGEVNSLGLSLRKVIRKVRLKSGKMVNRVYRMTPAGKLVRTRLKFLGKPKWHKKFIRRRHRAKAVTVTQPIATQIPVQPVYAATPYSTVPAGSTAPYAYPSMPSGGVPAAPYAYPAEETPQEDIYEGPEATEEPSEEEEEGEVVSEEEIPEGASEEEYSETEEEMEGMGESEGSFLNTIILVGACVAVGYFYAKRK